ncbi:hypothetical protein CPC08DRAFT_822900 [Agrocybe pediades]|nr:hypothetical protein CPC08DRAFT_822900 [Agrocybe pediades]
MGLISYPLSEVPSRIARFFFPRRSKMTADIRIPSLKDGGRSDSAIFEVDDWLKMVCAGNNSEDDVHTFMVQRLDWYKNTVGFQHEYLVATISGLDNITIYLRFERRSTSEQLKKVRLSNIVGDENEKDSISDRNLKKAAQKALNEERKLINAAKGPYLSQFSKASSSSTGSNLKAADHVMRVRNPLMLNDDPSDEAYLMSTYNNFQNPFSLRDLAIIVHEVSKDSPYYNAITEQCFWFVRTVVGVATALYRPAEQIKTEKFDRAGKFITQSVNRDIPLEVGKFVKKITMAWKDGKGGRLDAERQKEQAEQDRARAEARVCEEAEARVEAETRAHAESKAREAETKARLEAEARMRDMEEELARYRGRGTCREA